MRYAGSFPRILHIRPLAGYVYAVRCTLFAHHHRPAVLLAPVLCISSFMQPGFGFRPTIQEYHLTRILVIQPTLETRCNQRITTVPRRSL